MYYNESEPVSYPYQSLRCPNTTYYDISGPNKMGYESQIILSISMCANSVTRKSLFPNIPCRSAAEIQAMLAKNLVNVKIYPITSTMNPNDFSDDPI